MQIYAKLNENKSIAQYATEPQEDYKQLTIDEANAHFLPEYHNLMWADDNGLVHADNLPVTTYERQAAEREARIKQLSEDVDTKLGKMDDKIKAANAASDELDGKINDVNSALLEITQTMATLTPAESKGE